MIIIKKFNYKNFSKKLNIFRKKNLILFSLNFLIKKKYLFNNYYKYIIFLKKLI